MVLCLIAPQRRPTPESTKALQARVSFASNTGQSGIGQRRVPRASQESARSVFVWFSGRWTQSTDSLLQPGSVQMQHGAGESRSECGIGIDIGMRRRVRDAGHQLTVVLQTIDGGSTRKTRVWRNWLSCTSVRQVQRQKAEGWKGSGWVWPAALSRNRFECNNWRQSGDGSVNQWPPDWCNTATHSTQRPHGPGPTNPGRGQADVWRTALRPCCSSSHGSKRED